MSRPSQHRWEFKSRFRRGAFGWKSRPAIARVKQAVAEIRSAAKRDPARAGEGAVALLERLSPALEHVDSSSGAIGTAVNHAIAELVPIIATAPVDAKTRGRWLERLFEAHQADQIPYIERLAEHWGELCASKRLRDHRRRPLGGAPGDAARRRAAGLRHRGDGAYPQPDRRGDPRRALREGGPRPGSRWVTARWHWYPGRAQGET